MSVLVTFIKLSPLLTTTPGGLAFELPCPASLPRNSARIWSSFHSTLTNTEQWVNRLVTDQCSNQYNQFTLWKCSLLPPFLWKVREIFADYDPHFLPMSLDEAYLDITEHLEQRKHWPESMRTHYVCESRTDKGAGTVSYTLLLGPGL